MKIKTLIIAAMAILMVACSSRSSRSNNDDSNTTENLGDDVNMDGVAMKTSMEKFVAGMYAQIVEVYNADDLNEISALDSVLTEEHLSKSYKEFDKFVETCLEECEDTVGFVGSDCDLWIRAQDWNRLQANVVDSKVLDKGKGIVKVAIKDGKSSRNAYLLLVREDGDWKIDNFLWSENPADGEREMIMAEFKEIYKNAGKEMPEFKEETDE